MAFTLSFNVSGGIPPYEATLSNNSGFNESKTIASDGLIIFNNLNAGTYDLDVTSNDGACLEERIIEII